MKHFIKYRPSVVIATVLGVGVLLSLASGLLFGPFVLPAFSQQGTAPKPSNAADAQMDVRTISERLPDQAHVMADVGYHFANLWFAADKQNWPLANYYLAETRSHLKWAVRIHPVRKTSGGAEVNLKAILDAVDGSSLADVDKAIANKDPVEFKAAYRQTVASCYTCHAACEKPYLRPRVPTAPAASILDFDPNPTDQ